MPDQTAAAPGPLAMLAPFAMMFLIFYILVFRPQSKTRKAHALMVKNLKKYDEIVTNGGIFGTVVIVKPDAITIRVDENVRVSIEPSAVARLVKSKEQGSPPQPVEKKR